MKLCECGCGLPAPIATATDPRMGWVKGQPKRFRHGHWARTGANKRPRPESRTHGLTINAPDGGRVVAREYHAYHDARNRCTNPNAKSWSDYGGRGIKFLFTSFERFMAELGPRPEGMSLDRKNNDGNYEPGNVRWATRKEQQNNRRKAA